jgi:hypothetical protein
VPTLDENIGLLRGRGYKVSIEGNDPDWVVINYDGKTIIVGEDKDLDDLVAGRRSVPQIYTDQRLNSCAISTFRDTADGDYITARLAFRAACYEQFLWSAEQAVEKYLKCILVLRRIPRPTPDKNGRRRDMGHCLQRGIDMIGTQILQLTPLSRSFIEYLEKTAPGSRYFELSRVAKGNEHVSLDRTVWELRRFCTPCGEYAHVKLTDGLPPPKILLGGRLERVIDAPASPGREALLWQNAFFGRRTRRRVGWPRWGLKCENAPLYVMPDVAEEFAKYAQLPKEAESAYKELAEMRYTQRTIQENTNK